MTSKTSRARVGCNPNLALANPPDLNQIERLIYGIRF
jgi:hypothetical protein